MRRRNNIILSVVLIALIASASAYGVYLATYSEPSNNYPDTSDNFTPVTITDYRGENITISSPVKRIVSLNSGFTEIICALGGEDLIVGREQFSTFPASMQNVPIVASTASAPNVEDILELEPDLIVSDTMLIGKEALTTFEEAGINVIIEYPAQIDRVQHLITSLGLIMDNSKATALIGWMNYT